MRAARAMGVGGGGSAGRRRREGVGGDVEDAHHEGAFGGERIAGQGCYTGGFGHGFNRTESAG